MDIKPASLSVQLIKSSLAVLAIAALMSVAIKDGFSAVSWLKAYTISLFILAGMILYIVVCTLIRGAIYQWMLRMGARDSQWYFFPTDPPGFAKQRAEYFAAKAKTAKPLEGQT